MGYEKMNPNIFDERERINERLNDVNEEIIASVANVVLDIISTYEEYQEKDVQLTDLAYGMPFDKIVKKVRDKDARYTSNDVNSALQLLVGEKKAYKRDFSTYPYSSYTPKQGIHCRNSENVENAKRDAKLLLEILYD